ncbi:carbohydrate kinase family protein [Peribacillus sp. SCS-37]|uniref:carbohydrate kinase family protein n=1 Tax=Paraperibacillus esterisolvens TaxID=3115296 RepID=UPI0039062131
MFDVTAIGEVLIDFTQTKNTDEEKVSFVRNPGGAPANVLAALAKLKRKTAFIGKVGNDSFGQYLQKVLIDSGVDTKGLSFSNEIPTTLAFVHLDEEGDRSFSFYRSPGADMMLQTEEVDTEILHQSKVVHFGSLSLTDEPARTASLAALEHAKAMGKIISFDPNYRSQLWKSENHARVMMKKGLQQADIVKLSEEEFYLLAGGKELREGTDYLMKENQVSLLFVTTGSGGCIFRRGEDFGKVGGMKIKAVDTTGAGDAFVGGILHKVIEFNVHPSQLKLHEVTEMARFANIVAALSVTKKGGIPSMPSLEKVEQLLNSEGRHQHVKA